MVYCSEGWLIEAPNQSTYIYACQGAYLLRYNIANNTIDKAVKINCSPNMVLDVIWNFTADGRYVVVYNWLDKSVRYVPNNISLVDFDTDEVHYLAEENMGEDLLANMPQSIRNGFDAETLRWDDSNNGNHLDNLNYSLERVYDAEKGSSIYSENEHSQKHEITNLRNTLLNNELPCVGIDGETVGSLIPVDLNDAGALGL